MDSNASLSELLHNLDATTYFFVSSGLFVGIVAVVFFLLGLWFGGLLWRGYKRRHRAAEATIESLKNEAAQLKRCIAGQTTRSLAGSSSPEPPEPWITATVAGPEAAAPVFPLGQPFTVWTEPPTSTSLRITDLLSVGPATTAPESFTAPLLFPSQRHDTHPASLAFSIWTEESWAPAAIPLLFSSPSAAFTVWTSEDYELPQAPQAWPASAAFTLWTLEAFIPPSSPTPVAPPALPQVDLTFPEDSSPSVPRSRAFTLWTQPAGTLPSTGISQRHALASLIRSRVEAPQAPDLPPLEVEPLPFVPSST